MPADWRGSGATTMEVTRPSRRPVPLEAERR
jgi:hypothetical protein